jgi:hypothetical protein
MYVLAYRHSRKLPICIPLSISYHGLIENRMFQIKIKRAAIGSEG